MDPLARQSSNPGSKPAFPLGLSPAGSGAPENASPRSSARHAGLLSPDDLSALTWVHAELRRCLESANKTLRRYLREANSASHSDLDAVDPSVLRAARAQLHQGVGALELVNQPAAAKVLRAAEAVVQRLITKPALATTATVDVVERVSFALLDFLGRHLAGKPVSPVAMYPQYEAALTLAGADRVHPADLWQQAPRADQLPALSPLATDTPRRADDTSRGDMESLVLGLMREPGRQTCLRMSQLCADLACGAQQRPSEAALSSMWHTAAAVYEALAGGLLAHDVHTKRMASRLLAQLRASARGQVGLSERLAQDLLFFCAHAAQGTVATPRLAAVRKAWALHETPPASAGAPVASYSVVRLGLHDPALLASAKRRVAAAKDTWAAVAGEEQHRASNLMEQFSLVGESLQRLFPNGESLAHALSLAAAQTAAGQTAPPPALAMEVATAVLYVDAALEDGELDQPELPARMQQLAQRVDDVRAGVPPRPLETWMEELYRRVSDRQTMGSVVQELRSSLSDVEKHIDQFFRLPSDRTPIVPVPGQLSAMRGVLSVLGLDQASQAVLHMRGVVEALLHTEVDAQQAAGAGTFDRLADNLGALSFLIDMLSVQPALAKSLFRFDAQQGNLSAVMGQGHRNSAFSALDEMSPLPAATAVPVAAPAVVSAATSAVASAQAEADVPAVGAAASAAAAAHLPAVSATGTVVTALTSGSTITASDGPSTSIERAAARSAAGPGSAWLGDAGLQDRVQALAGDAARPTVGDDQLIALIELLTQQAMAADRRDLLRLLSQAQRGLRESVDPATSKQVRAELVHNITQSTPEVPALPVQDRPVPPPRPTPLGGTGLEDDAEMLGVFLEEAREVVDQAQAALLRAQGNADAANDLTVIRRAFHTLKGSARMVGLREFGEAAWACEQLYNARIAQAATLDEPLRVFTSDALAYMQAWAEAIGDVAAGQPMSGHHAQPVLQAAEALRLQGRQLRIEAPAMVGAPELPALKPTPTPTQSPAPAPAPTVAADVPPPAHAAQAAPALPQSLVARVSNLPSASDLDLVLPSKPHVAAPQAESFSAVDLELDLAPLPEAPVQPVRPAAPEQALAAAVLPADEPDTAPEPAPTRAETGAHNTIEFLVDVKSLDDAQAAATLAPAAPANATPPPAMETLELDFAEFDHLMKQQAAEAAAPSPVVAPAVPSVLTPDPLPPALAVPTTPPEPPKPEPLPPPPAAPAHTKPAPLRLVTATPAVAEAPDADASASTDADDDNFKRVGHLRIGIPLFNIFLNEADELSRRLVTELAEWGLESDTRPVPETCTALAHGLAGSAGTVGCADLSALARALEHALMRSQAAGTGRPGESDLFSEVAEEIRRLLHQFAAGFLREVPPELHRRLAEHERLPAPVRVTESGQLTVHAAEMAATPLPASVAGPALPVVPVQVREPTPTAAAAALKPRVPTGARADAFDDDQDIDARDSADPELFPIFDEEAEELLPQLQARLREWMHQPAAADAPAACMRTLHTFKGGARLAGAMRLGEMAHRLETAIEHRAALPGVAAADVLPLLARADNMVNALEDLRKQFKLDTQRQALDAAQARAAALAAAAVPAPTTTSAPPASAAAGPSAAPVSAPTSAGAPSAAALMVAGMSAAGAAQLAGFTATTAGGAGLPMAPPAPASPTVSHANEAAVSLGERDRAAVAEAGAGKDAGTAEPTARAPSEAATAAASQSAGDDFARAAAAGGRGDAAQPPATERRRVDWSRFDSARAPTAGADERAATGPAAVRVRASLLDRLLNQAGEVTIARTRIDADVKQLQLSLVDLNDSLERMRQQLRDIEVQAESQISSRLEAAKAAAQSFDPLEMDRFTRLQELTRSMAESVNDVGTLQRGLQRSVQSAEDQLAAQGRLTRDLQDDLLRTRMVEFESAVDRLYRTVRHAAKEAGKQVRLDIVGGAIELDRGVLERMTGPFEHLLRNCVAHGVEPEAQRLAAGKTPVGQVSITVSQSGNEVAVDIADDGAGLDLQRIRQRAIERGLLPAGAAPNEAELAQLIFRPGFSTADAVTELAGRGVGLDVVRAEVSSMGGRIETQTVAGQGTRFKLLLPLTTAVTQVVMLRCGDQVVAVPSTLIEGIRRVPAAEIDAAYRTSELSVQGEPLQFYWLAALLQAGTRGSTAGGQNQAVAVVRSAAQRVAVHIDEVMGNQEVVVKNVGPQLARVPGLAGVTLLASGAVALIYNPVALSSVYGEQVRQTVLRSLQVGGLNGSADGALGGPAAAPAPAPLAPLVLVVDDSITVRRATERLLSRQGYRVLLAKDGMEALELLAGERPVALLTDIEMPRMDGFDLLRNVRADSRLANLPVVMITSRIAHKHREHATELGADHYLGKPYGEAELLELVARYAAGRPRAGIAV